MEIRFAAAAVTAALVLVGCEQTAPIEAAAPASGLPDPAQATCMSAVANRAGNATVTVLGSSSTLAGSEVVIGVGEDRTPWRCNTTSDGTVREVAAMAT